MGFVVLVFFSLSCNLVVGMPKEEYDEELFIKPLPSGHVYSYFQFTVRRAAVGKDAPLLSNVKHYRLFSRSLGEIVGRYSVQELHLRLTQGLWRHRTWGYPFIDAPPGAELWVWFHKDTTNVDQMWDKLTNALSGQFCASLHFIDGTNTVQPKLSFRPWGVSDISTAQNLSLLRYAALQRETVCTENLTPWKKLLPCDSKAGLSTLLNAAYLFNTNYVSLAIDLQPVCKENSEKKCTNPDVELRLAVSVIHEVPTSQHGKQDWSLNSLFGMPIVSVCPVASNTTIFVDTSTNGIVGTFVLSPSPSDTLPSILDKERRDTAVYDIQKLLQQQKTINIAATYAGPHIYWIIPPPVIHASRYITGNVLDNGGIRCQLHNHHVSKALKVVYMEVIPWYLRVYLHTLQIVSNGNKINPDWLHYRPAKDRESPHYIEMAFTLPPQSVTAVGFKIERAFLKWTEYPPDANHGFYVGSAIISTLLDSPKNFSGSNIRGGTIWSRLNSTASAYFLLLHTEGMLVSLPTPDFSMPYNVICLACTVVALAFGPMHNITTKRLVLADTTQPKGLINKLKRYLARRKEGQQVTEEKPKSD